MKRTASKAALTSSKSSFNPSMTLFSLDNRAASTSTPSSSISNAETSSAIANTSLGLHANEVSEDGPRRSKRVKRVHTTLEERVEDAVLTEVTETVVPELPLTIRRSPRKGQVKKYESDSDEALPTPKASPERKASASPRKPKPIAQSLETPHPAPKQWMEMYDAIKGMRSKITAPVDTMGCDRAQYKETEPKNQRFAILISLMLSSQTKDEVTDAAVNKLRQAVGGTLSLEAVLAADESTISEAINKVGFWRRKTQYIKQSAQRLHDSFDSDVPKTVDELCSLPGVGPKMAFLCLQSAWKLNHGIGVDVHVHRITNWLGWHRPPTKTPEQTRLNIQSWLPKELHTEINHLLVGFGQVICTPVAPRCSECTLSPSGLDLCPSARTEKVVKRKVQSKVVKKGKATAKGKVTEIKEEDVNVDVDVDVDMHAEAKAEDIEDLGISAGASVVERKAELVDELVKDRNVVKREKGVGGVKVESDS